MKYTQKQIENAKRAYQKMLNFRTVEYYQPEFIGRSAAEQRCDYHNEIVREIRKGNQEVIREWKLFYLRQEVLANQKEAESKAKKAANRAASADILEPIKKMRKLGEFGRWLNTTGNPFRSEHFSKKYTQESVNTFLSL